MADLLLPYNAEVTFKVTFKNSAGADFDPDVVELDVFGATYTYALAEITKTAVGHYEKTLVADTPGRTKRIWVGDGPGNYYVESKVATINVEASRR